MECSAVAQPRRKFAKRAISTQLTCACGLLAVESLSVTTTPKMVQNRRIADAELLPSMLDSLPLSGGLHQLFFRRVRLFQSVAALQRSERTSVAHDCNNAPQMPERRTQRRSAQLNDAFQLQGVAQLTSNAHTERFDSELKV